MGAPMLFTLSAGGATVAIRNREEGDLEVEELGQEIAPTDGDQVYAYDLGLTRKTYSADLENVPEEQKVAFDTWFRTVCKGVMEAFDVVIPRGSFKGHPVAIAGGPITVTNAHFEQGGLPWTQDSDGWWSVSFRFFTQSEGPTGPPA